MRALSGSIRNPHQRGAVRESPRSIRGRAVHVFFPSMGCGSTRKRRKALQSAVTRRGDQGGGQKMPSKNSTGRKRR